MLHLVTGVFCRLSPNRPIIFLLSTLARFYFLRLMLSLTSLKQVNISELQFYYIILFDSECTVHDRTRKITQKFSGKPNKCTIHVCIIKLENIQITIYVDNINIINTFYLPFAESQMNITYLHFAQKPL